MCTQKSNTDFSVRLVGLMAASTLEESERPIVVLALGLLPAVSTETVTSCVVWNLR